MKNIVKIAAFVLSILSFSACTTIENKDNITITEPAWTPLFNKDLSNAIFDKNVWSIDSEGVLRATKDEIIFSDKDFENFELELEFRIEKESNSGIVIYCSNMDKWIPNSLEIQIADSSSKRFGKPFWNCACIFGHVDSEFDTRLEFGKWHKMRVRADGKKIDVFLNDRHACKMDMSQWTDNKKTPNGEKILPWLTKHKKCEMLTKGRIGLQGKHGGASTDYRNIMIRPIK